MFSFKAFLAESLDVEKLKHLEHAEDHIIHGGDEGVQHAADNLDDLHNLMKGKKSKSKITVKYDGSPSVVFGKHPETGGFFVASKSAFNVNPKINYTPEDNRRNHGHAPGLVNKLTTALEHLPKVMPKDGGVYQGDFLYDRGDLRDEEGKYKFTQNTITYAARKDSPQGRKIAASKMGFVVHTKYSGKNLGDMKASFDVDHDAFQQDPHVNLVNPEVRTDLDHGHDEASQKEYEGHKAKALEAYRRVTPEAMETLGDHDVHLKTYINSTVRDGTKPTTIGYIAHLSKKRDTEMGKVKTEASKKKKADQFNGMIDRVLQHKKGFSAALEMHGHLQNAKNTLIKALGNPTEFEHTVGGKEVKPEGFVSIRGGRPTKLVDREEFSRLNFANNRGKGDPEAEPPSEKEVHHVFAFGRMNPPTVGHGALVDKVKEVAKANNADHTIVLSHSQDPEKNPLSPEEKLKHAKRFFPGTNIHAATKDSPTFIHQLRDLHKKGVTHLTMVAGSDRVEEYKKLLDRYNGPGKDFNFKSVNVVSAGERDPDAEGVSGMSASKMRAHAYTDNFHRFKEGIPAHVSPEHAREMFNDVKRGMSSPKPKKLKEETTGDIRGLGLVSGNPMIDTDAVEDYISRNIAASDIERKELDRRLEKWGLRGFIDHTKSIDTKKAKGTVF
jgi:hypothetical protein